MAFTCSVHVSWIGVSEERQEVICMAPHVLSCLSPKLFKVERDAPLRQLILHSAVHAVPIRGDLFDLQVPLHQLLSQLQTLLMTGAFEILHFRFSNPDLPLLLKSSLFLLKKHGIFSVFQNGLKYSHLIWQRTHPFLLGFRWPTLLAWIVFFLICYTHRIQCIWNLLHLGTIHDMRMSELQSYVWCLGRAFYI